MSDAKRIPAVSVTPDTETDEIVIRIPCGLIFTVADVGTQAIDLTLVHPDNHARALVRGWYERFKDKAAVNRADADGNIIPKADHAAIKATRLASLAAHYETGTDRWSATGDGTGGGRSITVEAFARVRGITYAEADAKVTTHAETMFGGDRKKALANIATAQKVIDAVAAIRAERQPEADINADETVDSL